MNILNKPKQLRVLVLDGYDGIILENSPDNDEKKTILYNKEIFVNSSIEISRNMYDSYSIILKVDEKYKLEYKDKSFLTSDDSSWNYTLSYSDNYQIKEIFINIFYIYFNKIKNDLINNIPSNLIIDLKFWEEKAEIISKIEDPKLQERKIKESINEIEKIHFKKTNLINYKENKDEFRFR